LRLGGKVIVGGTGDSKNPRKDYSLGAAPTSETSSDHEAISLTDEENEKDRNFSSGGHDSLADRNQSSACANQLSADGNILSAGEMLLHLEREEKRLAEAERNQESLKRKAVNLELQRNSPNKAITLRPLDSSTANCSNDLIKAMTERQ